jgi:hypothetical protein
MPEHGQREPVDLEEEDSGNVRLDARSRFAGDAMDDPEGVRVVIVRPDHDLDHDLDGRKDDRSEQCPPERVDRYCIVGYLRREVEHPRVNEEHEHEAQDELVWQPERRHERWQQRIQHGDDHRDHQSAPEAVDRDARNDRGRDHHGDRSDQPADEQAGRPEARALRLPDDALAEATIGRRRCDASVIHCCLVRTRGHVERR